jgi:hypothetical protein
MGHGLVSRRACQGAAALAGAQATRTTADRVISAAPGAAKPAEGLAAAILSLREARGHRKVRPSMSVPVQWIVGLMVGLEPSAPWRDTFERSAEAIARVSESEPVFEERGEERTAALLVAIAWYESRFKPTARSKDGQFLCLFQVDKQRLPDPQKALADPEVCARAAIKIVRASLQRCARSPADDRLAMFTSGACDRGVLDSRYRMFLAGKLLREHPPSSAGGGGTARAR